MTHELRTPLNAMIGFAELLSGDHPFLVAEERRREYAGIIRDSGHHLLAVVNTLLDMSRIETGQFAFAPATVDLAAVARGCCDLLALDAERAGIAFAMRIAEGGVEAVADPRACRQILINLISNAVKFTPVGGRVTVEVRQQGKRIVLAVSDDGVGIHEADLSRVGEPFFQAGGRDRLCHDGTGLGLSVVRGLVGLHRGSITIESGAGLGTTVAVELPTRASIDAAGAPVDVRTVARRTAPILERVSA